VVLSARFAADQRPVGSWRGLPTTDSSGQFWIISAGPQHAWRGLGPRFLALSNIQTGRQAESAIGRSGAEQSNKSVVAGDVILKAFRKLQPGSHPELEVGRYLTEAAGFRNCRSSWEALSTFVHQAGPRKPDRYIGRGQAQFQLISLAAISYFTLTYAIATRIG
jgi:hypothetical protein